VSFHKIPQANSNDNLLFSHQNRASTYLDFIQKRTGKKAQAPREKELFLSSDEKMLRIQDIVWQIASTDVPVLITGEAGVGKKIIAHAIHDAKSDTQRPYLVVDCAQLSPAQIDAALFAGQGTTLSSAEASEGNAKSPFAPEGTVVLHEITNLDASQQTKLLRILQEKELEQKNTHKPAGINARIIATTSRDIINLVSQGKFRQDLYYRLYVLHIDVPPLRQRPKDVLLFAHHYLEEYKKTVNRPNLSFSQEALDKLTQHEWPGNVRELEKAVHKALLLSGDDQIKGQSLQLEGASEQVAFNWIQNLPIGQCLRLIETHFILETLKFHKGNRTHAAKALGISLRTLRNKINEFTAEGFEVIAPVSGRAPR
jgi:DNA-binding NtrC family response regulator